MALPAGVTPGGFLLWISRMQWTTVLQGTVCDVIWLLGLALTPWAIGRAIDEGLVAGDYTAFLRWLAVVIWLQLQHSLIQGLRDLAGSVNFERASSRVNQVIAHASTRVMVAADQKLPAGAMVTVATSDSWAISFIPINVGTLISSLVAFITVSVLLLRDSVLLGLLVIIGVPAFALLQFAPVKSLHKRQRLVRTASEEMNAVAADSVKGMRVLRGVVVSDPVPLLFSGTLRSVLDPRSRHDDAALLRAVGSVDALDIVESADGGLDVLVGEGGVEFSGGQRQRLGAARALPAAGGSYADLWSAWSDDGAVRDSDDSQIM